MLRPSERIIATATSHHHSSPPRQAFDALPSWETEAAKYEKLKPVVLDLHVDDPKQRASESTAEVVARIKAHSDETDEVTLPYPCAPFRGDPAENEGRVFKLPLISDSASGHTRMMRGRDGPQPSPPSPPPLPV
jgi:hypothetical protein